MFIFCESCVCQMCGVELLDREDRLCYDCIMQLGFPLTWRFYEA